MHITEIQTFAISKKAAFHFSFDLRYVYRDKYNSYFLRNTEKEFKLRDSSSYELLIFNFRLLSVVRFNNDLTLITVQMSTKISIYSIKACSLIVYWSSHSKQIFNIHNKNDVLLKVLSKSSQASLLGKKKKSIKNGKIFVWYSTAKSLQNIQSNPFEFVVNLSVEGPILVAKMKRKLSRVLRFDRLIFL